MEYKIRPIELGDEEGINRLRRLPGVFENIQGLPSERVKKSQQRIEHMDDDSHEFVAVDMNGEIIGSVGLQVINHTRRRHSASIGIMVDSRYQNQQIGSQLLEAVLDIADNWLMLVRVELMVFADNQKAIHLYQKYGFEIEGRMAQFSIRNGEYADGLLMARIRKS